MSNTISSQQQPPYIQQADNSYPTASHGGHHQSQFPIHGLTTYPHSADQVSYLPLQNASTKGDKLTEYSDPYIDPVPIAASTQQPWETDIYLEQQSGCQPTRFPPSEETYHR